jgi:hypothetical protein
MGTGTEKSRLRRTDEGDLEKHPDPVLSLALARKIGAVAQEFEDNVSLNTLVAYAPSFHRRPEDKPDPEHAPAGWNELMDTLDPKQRRHIEVLLKHIIQKEHLINHVDHKMETLGDLRLYLTEGNTVDHLRLGPRGVAFGRIAFGKVKTV